MVVERGLERVFLIGAVEAPPIAASSQRIVFH